MRIIILCILSSLFYYYSVCDIKALCSESFCKTYTSRNKCNALPEACRVQNATHNGEFLPYPGPCNCCDYCLENLASGAVCAKGDPTSSRPTAMCGPLLTCKLLTTSSQTTCQKMSTPCVEEQKKYDKAREDGTLGHLELRPKCDRNGLYAPFACVPGEICYCVSKDGRRLFGEIPYTAQADYILKCKCSRKYDDALQNDYNKLYTPDFLRCQSQGDFDSLQCIEDSCLCVDNDDGHPTYPNAELVNISDISQILLPCFNSKFHAEGSYYRKCESEKIKRLVTLKEFEKEGHDVFGISLPNCQLDGFYAPVQYEDDKKYCAAPSGEKLEKFEVEISDPLSSTMTCKCARARSIITSEEKPSCCQNGNYKKMQCRRGMCRCVNDNGVQTLKEVEYTEREQLPCYNKCHP